MEGGEKKSGSKKRSKVIPSSGCDSGDDETIVSLFKAKNKKTPKKAKALLSSVNEKEDDLGGFNDTLAIFKKKLKRPKKVRLGSLDETDTDSPNGNSLSIGNAGIEENKENAKEPKSVRREKKKNSNRNQNEKDRSLVSNEVVGQDLDENLEDPLSGTEENKEKAKESKSVKKKKNGNQSDKDRSLVSNEVVDQDLDENLEDPLSGIEENNEKAKESKSVKKEKKNNGIQSEKDRALVSNEVVGQDLDENTEDPLSVLLRKAPSGLNKKSGNNLKTKQKSKTQTSKAGESSQLVVSKKPAEFDDIPTESTLVHEKIELNQNSDVHMEDTRIPVNIDVKAFNHDKDEEMPQSGLNGCSPRILRNKEAIVNKKKKKILSLSDCDCNLSPQNGNSEKLLSDKFENDCSLQTRELTPIKEEACGDHDDELTGSEEANRASSSSVSPERSESHEEEKKELLPSLKSKNKKLSEILKRKTKKRRHDDMAYEDDVNWEDVIHEEDFSQHRLVEENGPSLIENIGVAAVSAGLKAHAMGPLERIKFKEILKRKGGQQEYLECRNQILALWNKDVTRVLPLVECGVTASHLRDETQRDSLTREIYEFLNRRGYINVGIASEKDIKDLSTGHNLKLVKENSFGKKTDAPDADADDGVSFILGQVKDEASVAAKSSSRLDNNNQVGEALEEKELAIPQTMGLSTNFRSNQCEADVLLKHTSSTAMYPQEMVRPDDVFFSSSFKAHDNKEIQSSSIFTRERDNGMDCVSERKKRIIVIGAGPAGLTAARHLQRHGFSVDVLEARNRVGGRVYTDRSSLSVPVDLGASIITGVEADVATERRPDPSSLVCAQLGLELTVLKSDCPLYDVVTGQKVPTDLDETLEAEYNSLLDDMLLIVAQKGERAMKMSLEDGLEYALKGRRMVQSGRNCMENEMGKYASAFGGSMKNGVDGKVYRNDSSKYEVLNPLERRVMDWHFAHLEYGCAALLQDVSLPYWNQDDVYGGFGGAHCMIKGGYSAVVESLGEGLHIHLDHIVTNISYRKKDYTEDDKGSTVKVYTSNGREFSGDAVLVTVPLGCLKARDIDFSPPLPHWKELSIQRLGFGVLNKVVLEFPDVFWDDSVDYFGATAEETDLRGKCFMFWNVKKTVGAPVLIALVVGKAAIEGQKIDSSDLVDHALAVLVKLFGKDIVPEPVASVVTDWGNDPFSYGAYSYVAIGSSGEDYDILGRPVENCLFFAGEATCKEYPDTVGGAMLSGLREAVRIIDLMLTGNDYTAEVETLEVAQRHLDSERNEVLDIAKRLEAIELSSAIYRRSLDGARTLTRKSLLRDMFDNAKTTAGRLLLAKELLNLPVEALKSFAGTKNGLSILNTWILDSMGKDGTQLLRHCVRLLVVVSTDLLAVRLSGVGKTVKEKVCVHTSRDIRAIASQLVNVWIEVFRKEKASNAGLKLLRHSLPDHKRSLRISASSRSHLPPSSSSKRVVKPVKLYTKADARMELKGSMSQSSAGEDLKGEEDYISVMSEEEKAAFAAAEAARAAALAAAEAYASSEAKCNSSLPLPKIPSFHKFTRREQYTQIDDFDVRKKCSGATLGRQDCISEIDSRNCRVRDWSVAFPAGCAGLENPNNSVDNFSQRSNSNEIRMTLREHSADSAAVDSSIYTTAWVDGCGSEGLKDFNAIDRWQSQAAMAESEYFHENSVIVWDEEESNVKYKPHLERHERRLHERAVSQVTVNKDLVGNQPRGAENIKLSVVDYAASLLMPLYKAKKIDKDGYKSIMKKTATKVMEQTTDAEKSMAVYEFLDFKRKTKIRAFVDKLIEKHLGERPVLMP